MTAKSRRIAGRFDIVGIVYHDGKLIRLGSMESRADDQGWRRGSDEPDRDELIQAGIERLQKALGNRLETIDISRDGELPSKAMVANALGFKLKVRGLGVIFAIKREVLRRLLSAKASRAEFLRVLADEGWLLLRGADGGATRQLAIPGLPRARYYCLNLDAAGIEQREPPFDRARFEAEFRPYFIPFDGEGGSPACG